MVNAEAVLPSVWTPTLAGITIWVPSAKIVKRAVPAVPSPSICNIHNSRPEPSFAGEEQCPVDGLERIGIQPGGARDGVGDEHGPRRRAIALPQLSPGGIRKGREVQRTVHFFHVERVGIVRRAVVGIVPGMDVLDHDRSRCRAVRLPQFPAVRAVSRREEQDAVDFRKARCTWTDCPSLPASMSLTKTVPPLVPSDFHNSSPFSPSSAVKNRVSPMAISELLSVKAAVEPAAMSLTKIVPAAVPSDFQSSCAIGSVVGHKE